MSTEIIRLNESHIPTVSRMYSRIFQEDPITKYLFPEKDIEISLYYTFQYMVREGILYGEGYATLNLEGAAFWMDSENTGKNLWRMLRSGLLPLVVKLGIKTVLKMDYYDTFAKRLHIKHADFHHIYLCVLGVDLEHQRRGHTKGLLNDKLSSGLSCYLETTNPENISFYEHHGFELLEESTLPDTELKIFPMLRK